MFVRLLFIHRHDIRETLPLLVLACCFPCHSQAFAGAVPAIGSRVSSNVSEIYGALPLSFERNQGQAEGTVRYLAHGPGYSIFLKGSGATLVLSKRPPVPTTLRLPPLSQTANGQASDAKTDILQMRLIGGSTTTQVAGDVRLPGTVNYFTGNNPVKWIAGVLTFARVTYKSVYPGINLAYYGTGRQFEFDFQLAPGADSRHIRLRFDGAKKLSLDRDGNLIIFGANGKIQFHKPEIFQLLDGGNARPVSGGFSLHAKNTVSF